jgi:uncharacterized protein
VIDFHVHQPSGDAYSSSAYVDVMDDLGIQMSVVFTYDGLLHPSPAANDSLARFVEPFPDRLIAFATVNPRDPSAADEIERCVQDHGMRGVKLHPWLQGFSAHIAGLNDVCTAVAEFGIPLLFHDGTPPFTTPLQFASLAMRHPDATIVLGHGGLHDMWREAIAAVSLSPNIYLCMCATPPYAMKAIVEECRLDRLLFGTDAGLRANPYQRYAALRVRQLDRLGLTADQSEAIRGINALRLLRSPA